ncbi:MAG: STAS domain-containing protein [Gammaproteobacteria bacterium]|nr:STAS domain-containing protein [Gammaproteobacteria bacterium]
MSTTARVEKLDGSLSLHTAPPLLERLAAALPRSGSLTLDLSAVRYADSAGVSLLLELVRRAQAAGTQLQLAGAPEQLRRLTKFFGVDGLLPWT